MKTEYIDHYGIDSLPNLKEAVELKADVFVTTNKNILQDKKELEQYFKIKICKPEEIK